jgi:DNA-directed RNA polymerase subunit RPC12/RpoP
MMHKIYHGEVSPQDFARDLIAAFSRGEYVAQQIQSSDTTAVQVATRQFQNSGGSTAITIALTRVDDGVAVQLGQQAWLGVAASLGQTLFAALRNPLSILYRLDDVAQDIESLQLTDDIWRVIDQTAATHQATQELSEKLRRLVCPYCASANLVGESSCVACGAPLGTVQPTTCGHCGYVVLSSDTRCPNCGVTLPQ